MATQHPNSKKEKMLETAVMNLLFIKKHQETDEGLSGTDMLVTKGTDEGLMHPGSSSQQPQMPQENSSYRQVKFIIFVFRLFLYNFDFLEFT